MTNPPGLRFGVRIEFTHRGERLHDILGPFDHFIAECVITGMIVGYQYGPTLVHVERARIVPWS